MNSVHLVECEVHDVLVKCQNFLDSFVISESYFRTEVVVSKKRCCSDDAVQTVLQLFKVPSYSSKNDTAVFAVISKTANTVTKAANATKVVLYVKA